MTNGVLILCGGKSSRMGTDKALLPFHEKTLLEHVIDVSRTLDLPIHLVGNPTTYHRFGLPVIPDEVESQGPLRGLLSGMKATNWEKTLLLSCDTPFLKRELLIHLLEEGKDYDALIPRINGKIHPLVGVYGKKAQLIAKEMLNQGQFRMISLLDAMNCRILDLSDHPVFGNEKLYVNMNTPEEVKLWE